MEQLNTLLRNEGVSRKYCIAISEFSADNKYFFIVNISEPSGEYIEGRIYSRDNLKQYNIESIHIEFIPSRGIMGTDKNRTLRKIDYDPVSDSFEFYKN